MTGPLENAPYEVVSDPSDLLENLSARERSLVRASLAFHALSRPGRTVRVDFRRPARPGGTPQLTGADPMSAGPSLGVVTVRGRGDLVEAAPVVKVAAIVTADGDAAEPPVDRRRRRRRFVDDLALRFPVWGDEVKQAALAFGLARADRVITDRVEPLTAGEPVTPRDGAPKSVLFGLYWLEHGGAEKWALETVKLARDEGLHPIVVTDMAASQVLAGHPALEGATLLVLGEGVAHEPLLREIARNYRLVGAVIHHSNWLYAALPLLRQLRPGIPTVDSLHVIEWENGGFPMVSARYDAFVDTHHVIAPGLRDYLTDVKHVDPAKVVYAPLRSLGFRKTELTAGRRRFSAAPVTLGYVGRAVVQKRPLLFLELVRRLRRGGTDVRAIMHGDGPLSSLVRERARRWGLDDVVEFRGPEIGVDSTYDEIDVLVISSQVEGLTLTSMEVGRAGVPIISADVGSQRVLTSKALLMSRSPVAFLRRSTRAIVALLRSPGFVAATLREQQGKADALAALEDAAPVYRKLFQRMKSAE